MVLKCLHGLAPDYLASKFSQRSTSYNLRDSANKLNVRLPPTNYFKTVLVIVWHYTMQYPSLQGMVHITVPSSRSNAPSVKLLTARYSRKAAF